VGYAWINSLKALAEKEVRLCTLDRRASANSFCRSPMLTSPLLRPPSLLIRPPPRRYCFPHRFRAKPEYISSQAFMYRRLFAARFPHPSATASVKTWVPTWGASKDPSGRAQAVHLQALQH
jgi:hypothetical protein